jgi:magnesium-transporting ATPase (P-type)
MSAEESEVSEIMVLPCERAAGLSVKDVLSFMRVVPTEGLTVCEASRRRNIHGFNEVVANKPDPLWKKYLDQFNNPFILLLLTSAVISVFMRQFDDAGKKNGLKFFLSLHKLSFSRLRQKVLNRERATNVEPLFLLQ